MLRESSKQKVTCILLQLPASFPFPLMHIHLHLSVTCSSMFPRFLSYSSSCFTSLIISFALSLFLFTISFPFLFFPTPYRYLLIHVSTVCLHLFLSYYSSCHFFTSLIITFTLSCFLFAPSFPFLFLHTLLRYLLIHISTFSSLIFVLFFVSVCLSHLFLHCLPFPLYSILPISFPQHFFSFLLTAPRSHQCSPVFLGLLLFPQYFLPC